MPNSLIAFDLAKHNIDKIFVNELDINLNDKHIIYWIHCDLTDQIHFNEVATKLNLPENVLSLLKQHDTMQKILDEDDSITIQIQCLLSTELDSRYNELKFDNLFMHLTSNYCFTASVETIPAILEFKKNYQKAARYAETPCFILFLILDNVVNEYAKILFNFEMLVDQMDVHTRTAHLNTYKEVMEIKQHVTRVKRNTITILEILLRISGRKISVISDQCRLSLSNLTNHTNMIVHEADSIREILNGLLDQIDNNLMQKMNETMRVLTAVAAIFLPLTLITGIYGMNFNWIPELKWHYGYFWALGLIVFCGSFMVYIFKKKKWF